MANSAESNQASEILQQGIAHHQSGRLPDAEKCYRHLLHIDPEHADANHLLGVIAYQVGNYPVAEQLITNAINRDSKQPLFHLNLGNVRQDQGQFQGALSSYRDALSLNPEFPEAHNNKGNALRSAGSLEEAVSCFQKAIKFRPEYAEAHNNLGNTLKDLDQLDEAIKHLRQAIALPPQYVEAYHNLARALFSNSQPDEAIESCNKAVALKPDFIDAHLNLGMILNSQGQHEKALESYRKIVAQAPDNTTAHAGLASVLRNSGMLRDALSSYARAIELDEHNEVTWEEFQQTLKAVLYLDGEEKHEEYLKLLPAKVSQNFRFKMMQFYLESFRPHEADACFDNMASSLPIPASVSVNAPHANTDDTPPLFKDTVALLHFGRSGTGLMHSLIDNHPEITTIPSIYLSGYFNAGVWQELSLGGAKELPDRFADKFAVIFDANSPQPVPGTQKEGMACIGIKEGTNVVGENRDEALKVDREVFCDHARNLIDKSTTVDAARFFQIIHAAYETALGKNPEGKSIFYHIHNPNAFAKPNFLRQIPNARLLMMIREPVQSCGSWMLRAFENNEYVSMSNRIISMLYDIDQIAFRRHPAIGLRLEDLKNQPEEVVKSLCKWLQIKENDSLYEMTAQGKKWWGDPSSPDYSDKSEMPPFDPSSINRSNGKVLGDRDRFLLETLFYPFRVHFGYTEPTPDKFRNDLKEARGLLDGLLDFEQSYIDNKGADSEALRRRGNYHLLRAALSDRLDILDEFGTYPHMLEPLTLMPSS